MCIIFKIRGQEQSFLFMEQAGRRRKDSGYSRIGNASCLLGCARGATEKAIDFAKSRKVGNKTVTDFQGMRWMIAEVSTRLEAVALLRDKAAWLEDRGKDPGREVAMAKLLAGEVSLEAISQMIQLTGSYGCYRDTPFERYWRGGP